MRSTPLPSPFDPGGTDPAPLAWRRLGAFETALALSDAYAPLHVVAALRLDRPAPAAHLPEALAALQRGFPVLRMRIDDAGGPRLVLADVPKIPLVVRPRRAENEWLEVAEEEAARRIDSVRGPMMRAVYLSPEQAAAPGDLILACHHTVIDARSGETLVESLLRAWAGEPLPEPDPWLPPPAELFYPAGHRRLRGALTAAAYLARQLGEEIVYRSARPQDPPPPAGARTRLDTFDLEAAETGRLVDAARRRRVTTHSLVSAAMLVALWRVRYAARPRILRGITFADLRPYLEPPVPPASPGSYLSMLRYSVPLRADDDLWSVAARLHARLTRMFRRGEKFTAAAQAPAAMRMILSGRAGRMGAMAFSYLGPLTPPREYGATRLRHLHAFVTNFDLGPEYSAVACLWDGRLQLDVMTLEGEMSQAERDQIRDEMKRQLTSVG